MQYVVYCIDTKALVNNEIKTDSYIYICATSVTSVSAYLSEYYNVSLNSLWKHLEGNNLLNFLCESRHRYDQSTPLTVPIFARRSGHT